MTKYISLFFFIFAFTVSNIHAMEEALLQNVLMINNWIKAYKKQGCAWEVFAKTPEGLQCARVDKLREEQPDLLELPSLHKKALEDACKTKEFSKFLKKHALENSLRRDLINHGIWNPFPQLRPINFEESIDQSRFKDSKKLRESLDITRESFDID